MGEFNQCTYYNRSVVKDPTNFQLALIRLRDAGFSEQYVNNFKIILWDIPNNFYGNNNSVKFEDFADAPNFFYLSGLDGSVVSFLLEGSKFEATPRNAAELLVAALDQELLNKLVIIKEVPKKKNKFKKK